MATKFIAGGAWVQVRVKLDDGKIYPFGLALNASYDEDWGIQPANVLNHLGPVSLDSQNYTCNINLGAYVPERAADLSILPDKGAITIGDLLPTRDEVQIDGKGRRYDLLQFVNTATQEILNQFKDVVIASNGTQINPNAYVSTNVRLACIKRTI